MSSTTTPDPSVATMAAIALSSVHNPTYFSGGFTNPLSVPGGGNGIIVPWVSYADASNNFNGKVYTTPSAGVYRMMGLTKFANTSPIGGCPAGVSIGCQFSNTPSIINYDTMQFGTTTPLRNTILYWLDLYMPAGIQIGVTLFSDVGISARNGTYSIMKVA